VLGEVDYLTKKPPLPMGVRSHRPCTPPLPALALPARLANATGQARGHHGRESYSHTPDENHATTHVIQNTQTFCRGV
jgi:hypothetical protein